MRRGVRSRFRPAGRRSVKPSADLIANRAEAREGRPLHDASWRRPCSLTRGELFVVEGIRRPLVGVELRAPARLLELLFEDVLLVFGLLHRTRELLVELALVRAHARDEVVEVARGLLAFLGP